MKRCSTCREIKPFSEFHKQKDAADGHCCFCKPCKSARKKAAYHANPHKARETMAKYRLEFPEKVAAAKKAARERKIEQYKAAARKSYHDNREERLKKFAEYRKKNRAVVSERNVKYVRERMKRDPIFRLTYTMRNRIFQACKDQRIAKKSKTLEMLGCEWSTLKERMEAMFQPGMTWGNYGKWHIDHIIPLVLAKTEDQLARLCHYSNLQPLWAADNIRKGAKVL